MSKCVQNIKKTGISAGINPQNYGLHKKTKVAIRIGSLGAAFQVSNSLMIDDQVLGTQSPFPNRG